MSLTCRCLLILEFLTQVVEVAESFRLFATVTTSKHDVSHALEGSFVLLNYCVITEPHSDSFTFLQPHDFACLMSKVVSVLINVITVYIFSSGRLTYSALWRKVMLGEPNREYMINIVNGCYPSLEPISSKLIGR
jgi:midasin